MWVAKARRAGCYILYPVRRTHTVIFFSIFHLCSLAKILDQKKVMQTACGTPGYVAPEVVSKSGGRFLHCVDKLFLGLNIVIHRNDVRNLNGQRFVDLGCRRSCNWAEREYIKCTIRSPQEI